MLDNSRRHQFIGQKTARAEQTQKNRKQKNYRKKVLIICLTAKKVFQCRTESEKNLTNMPIYV